MKNEEYDVINVEGGSHIKMWAKGVPVEESAMPELGSVNRVAIGDRYVYYAGGSTIYQVERRAPAVVFLGTILLIYPLPYYVVVSAVRYRVPVLWLSSLTAGYFLTAVAPRRWSAGVNAPPAGIAGSRVTNPY